MWGIEALLCFLACCSLAVLIFRITRVNNRALWGDGFTYFKIAESIAKLCRIPKELEFYQVADGRGDHFTLPPLLMLLLVPFRRMKYRSAPHLLYLIDLLIAVAIYFFARVIGEATPPQGTAAALIYLLSPINAFIQTQVTPRQLGAFFLLMFTGFFGLYLKNGDILYLAFCAPLVALLLLSQRMVTQILFIGVPLVAGWISFLDFKAGGAFLVAVAAGVALAFVFTQGHYGIVLHDHYRRIIQHARHGDQTTFRKKFGNPLQIIKANPWMVLLCLLVLLHGRPSPHLAPLSGYLVVSMALALLWVFGNSINHVYFASPLGAVLLGKYLLLGPAENIVVSVTTIWCVYMIFREYAVIARNCIGDDWYQCFGFIQERGLSGSVLVLPGVSCPPVVYYTDLKLVSAGHGSQAMEYNRLFLRKNITNCAFVRRFVEENRVSYLLLQKESLLEETRGGLTAMFAILFENESLCLLEIRLQA